MPPLVDTTNVLLSKCLCYTFYCIECFCHGIATLTTIQLSHQIYDLNSTRVSPVSAEGWRNAMAQIGGWVQQ